MNLTSENWKGMKNNDYKIRRPKIPLPAPLPLFEVKSESHIVDLNTKCHF